MFRFLFGPLDRVLFDKVFEPAYIRIHKRWGIGNFTLARWFFMVGLAMLGVAVFGFVIDPNLKKSWVAATMMLLEAHWTIYGLKLAIRLEDKYNSQMVDAVPENLRDGRNDTVENRLFFLALTLTVAFFNSLSMALTQSGLSDEPWLIARHLSFPIILCAYYFLSCTPRLPRRQKETRPKGVLAPMPSSAQ